MGKAQIEFSYRELLVALIKQNGLHKGIWQLSVRFGMQATNVGANDRDLNPAAILAVLGVGLEMVDKENNLAVDAEKVNPKIKPAHRVR